MSKVLITAIARHEYPNLIEQLEIPQEVPCIVDLNQSWISNEAIMPEGFCPYAWQSIYPYVFALCHGADHLHGRWMKNPDQALVSCSDGFRPVSFLIERIKTDES